VFTLNKLSIGVLAAMLSGMSMSAVAADDAEVAALRQEVNELKKLVQQLSAQQQTQQQQLPTIQPAASGAAAPVQAAVTPPARSKDGWAILPDGKTSAKLYGFVRADMIHDFEGAPPEKFSDLDKQPLNSTHPVDNKTQFTVNTTRIGVDFKTPTAIGDVTGKIEGDFWGASGTGATFRFRHAYLATGNWLFGHTWSPFAGQEYLPETVDFNTLSGGSLRRRPQVRYTYPMDNGNTFTVAAEEGAGDARFPSLSARFEHQLADGKGGFNVRAMAHEKRAVVNATNNNQVDEKAGYGAAIGAMYNFSPSAKLVGQYFHVKGDGSFVYGAGNGFSSVDNNTTNVHQLYLDEVDSAIIGMTYKFNPQWRSTLAMSWVEFKDNSDFAKANPAANKELKQTSLNLFYNPVPSLTFAGEYTYGEREVFNDDSGKQSRINLMARYNF
jgi:hypothetical protein